MTIIAYDGKYIAADKRICSGDIQLTTTKIFRDNKGIIRAVSGRLDYGLAMLNWHTKGAIIETFPDLINDNDNWCGIVVVDGNVVTTYEASPYPTFEEGCILAWGSGRDIALGAMAAGKNAIEAVKIASFYSISCGNGVDFYEL